MSPELEDLEATVSRVDIKAETIREILFDSVKRSQWY